jgi:hypothetical protein
MEADVPKIIFYLYFKQQADADRCRIEMEKKGFNTVGCDVLEMSGNGKWSLRLTTEKYPETDLDEFEQLLFAEAAKFNGEYDGYDRAV